MKKFLLVGNGIYRSGSTSMWEFMKMHPEIAVTIPKEYTHIQELNFRGYMQRAYNLLDTHKVLFDGSPGLFVEPKVFKKVLESHKKIKNIKKTVHIYLYRKDSFNRTVSMFNLGVKRYLRGRIPIPPYLNQNLTFKESSLKSKMIFFDDYKMLRQIEDEVGIENMFVVRLSEIESKQHLLYDFLGVSNIKRGFPHTNSTDSIPCSIESLKAKARIIESLERLRESIDELSNDNEIKIERRYLR